MPHNKKNKDSDDPTPLNFDEDQKEGAYKPLEESFTTREDRRGDNQERQYYEEEEALSPEEVEERKKEETL